MKVNIFRECRKYAELYVVSRESRSTYALFLLGSNLEEEYYFDVIADGIRRLIAAAE